MPKALSYADAVRILGQGPDDEWVRRLNDVTGGLLLGATITTTGVLGWFDAHAQFAKLSQQVVKIFSQRLTGAHRLSRTERVAAAHTVVVIAAFFERLAEDVPFKLAEAALSEEDQLRLATREASHAQSLAHRALRAAVRLPEPHGFRDAYLSDLAAYYRQLALSAEAFLHGLALWDRLGPGREEAARRALNRLPDRAVQRYEELLLDLRIDCPEVDLWLRDEQASALLFSVRENHELMRRLAGPAATPTGVAYVLTRAYRALLERPVVETGDLPAGLDVPSLRAAYLPSLFRITEAGPDFAASDERVWQDVPVRSDLHQTLAGYLTSPRAQTAPMVVLGQPGAGKSVLTKVLAAGLVEGDFLPIRVPLRDVDTALDLQRHIEEAVRVNTTETITWPRLAEAADGRLPVILLDGFDELLQATATSQSDYLYKVADFQQRERDLGRAVAVLATTRTSVADRATAPPDTLLLRLEPFDDTRISSWLAVWRETNGARLAERGLRTLPAEVALRFPDLAGQPLLLLMLALYDADENGLQHTGELSPGELYERLLTTFARREVRKAGPHLSDEECQPKVEQELRRLSVVAFAMLNRSAQWVTEADLERDLEAIFGAAPGADGGINPATLLLGRFFFVHRAQAVRGRQTLQTYEFLHATFGEYLVARFTWQMLEEAVARASVTASPGWNTDDGLLARLLSFAPLVVRAPIVRFLGQMAARLAEKGHQDDWPGTLARIYRRSQHLNWGLQAGEYRPVTMRMPARYAAYTANLILLAVIVSGELRFGTLAEPGPADPARQWHDQALLWHSQLTDEGWEGMIEALEISPCWEPDGVRDLWLAVGRHELGLHPPDPRWVFEVPEGEADFVVGGQMPATFRRAIEFDGGARSYALLHAVEPLLQSPLANGLWLFGTPAGEPRSVARNLLTALLSDATWSNADVTRQAYLQCAALASDSVLPDDEADALWRLLCNALQINTRLPLAVVLEVVSQLDEWLSAWGTPPTDRLVPLLHAAGVVLLGRAHTDPDSAQLLARICRRLVKSASGELRGADKFTRTAVAAIVAEVETRGEAGGISL
ncbi:NACHT domain-containing protein [Actinoplanes aureus]|uniref:NACHT N-terminal Helical domain-containing protein n=1 Tax=Actinoplanes aureus TaxID=2792083 RepID=A0A931G222_9ACTN|nr:hypothetical protein [Actinoplanes aureus]MBG0562874.1 hypothetical protein [Actinoplanes aureus]